MGLGIKHKVWDYSGLELQLSDHYDVVDKDKIKKEHQLPCAIILRGSKEPTTDELYATIAAMKHLEVELGRFGVTSNVVTIMKTPDGVSFKELCSSDSTYTIKRPEWVDRDTRCLN